MEVLGKVLTAFCYKTNNHTKSSIFSCNQIMFIIFYKGKKDYGNKYVSDMLQE